MKKRPLVFVTLLITIFSLFLFVKWLFFFNSNDVIKENTVTKEQASLSIVTIGERIESDNMYFIQWETLNDKEKSQTKQTNDIFLFSIEAFSKEKYIDLISDLVKKEKTVLFYGYRMNVEDILKDKQNLIPYYEIKASQKIHFYLYGYGYSESQKSMVPITIMGNFSKDKMNHHISRYLIDNFGVTEKDLVQSIH